MDSIWQAFLQAIDLIISLDPEVMDIAGRSLMISMTSSLMAALICIPLGSLIQFYNFKGKSVLITIIQTLFSVPTVVVGLLVYVLLVTQGPLGHLDWLFTPQAIVIGQVILITPIMLGLVISALSGVDRVVRDTVISLGASNFQAIRVLLREARFAVMAAAIMGFGRAISEVGLSMMVGGNIKGFTRTLTTAISLQTSMGALELGIALGIILLAIAWIINVILYFFQRGRAVSWG
jgi:tungstate transport system permease protein